MNVKNLDSLIEAWCFLPTEGWVGQIRSWGRWKVREGEGGIRLNVIEWKDVGIAPIQLKSEERHLLIPKAIGSDPLSDATAFFILTSWSYSQTFWLLNLILKISASHFLKFLGFVPVCNSVSLTGCAPSTYKILVL